MGALNSVLDMLYDDTDSTVPQSSESSEPQAETNDSTPTVLRHKRILDLDPRSPSEHIFRTPIVVDKSVSSASLATPEPVPIPSLVLDPRSPTCEFLRTPIIPPCSSSESRRVSPARVGLVVGPGAPSSGLAYASSESGIDSTEVSPDVRGDSHSSFSYNACKSCTFA
ncbi:uncharacterized protein LOC101850840 [Aplysia californica]|uniref:Uncharacterized protein LOC101850840 n=1 Tax=Aplysia californica TaxID=6500 RepID=A0ABM1A8U1_APLCA|nr:uncharacterized protein LOC101850840 [Aplysia californica]